MPSTGETVQEIKFWLELESELKHIDEQLKTSKAGNELKYYKMKGYSNIV
jgi:hypothetical protein